MRVQVRRWGVPLVLLAGTAAVGGGCGLVLNYGDLGGTGGAAGASASTGSTSSSAASGSGGGSTTASSGGGGGGGGPSASASASASSSSGMSSSSGGEVCAGTCLPQVSDWLLVLFHEAAGTLPSCQKTLAVGGTGPMGAPATCSACGCGTPTCGGPLQAELWTSDTTCGMAPNDLVDADATGCATFPGTTVALEMTEPNSTAPTTGGVPTLSPPTWSMNDETCSPTTQPGICPSTETCLAPAPGFSSCLASAAGASPVTCPVPGYTQHVFATSLTDARGCGCQCKCGACTGGMWKYATACPGTATGSAINFGACASAPSKDFLLVTTPPSAPASCTSDTVGPTGGVTAGPSLITVCCPP
jgi:hypothetical protein